LAKAYDLAGQPAQAAAARRRFLEMRRVSSRASALQKLCSINPTVFDYPFELGQIELRRGDTRKAYIWLHKAQALRPGDRRVAAALAELDRASAGPSGMAAVQDRIAQPAPRGRTGSAPTPNAQPPTPSRG